MHHKKKARSIKEMKSGGEKQKSQEPKRQFSKNAFNVESRRGKI